MKKRTPFRDGTQYLLLPEIKYGSKEYPETVVSMHRLGMEPELRALHHYYVGEPPENRTIHGAVAPRASKARAPLANRGFQAAVAHRAFDDLKFTPSAWEQNEQVYVGNITWEQALTVNQLLHVETPTLREFWNFYETLKVGKSDKKAVFDGLGNHVCEKQARAWYDGLFGKRAPFRSAWLDARFFETEGVLYLEQEHKLDEQGVLIPHYIQRAQKHLRENSFVDVASVNQQGLTTRASNVSDIKQWMPRSGCVAWFCADSGRAGLYCDGDPSVSVSGLGVIASASRERAPFL